MVTVENLLFTFVLLNKGVPDVVTIYFVLVKQKKENRCVSDHEK